MPLSPPEQGTSQEAGPGSAQLLTSPSLGLSPPQTEGWRIKHGQGSPWHGPRTHHTLCKGQLSPGNVPLHLPSHALA